MPSSSSGQRVPILASVRKLLDKLCLSDPDFDAFCLDHFPVVYRSFSRGMNRTAKTTQLLEVVETPLLIEKLEETFPDREDLFRGTLKYEPIEAAGEINEELGRLGAQMHLLWRQLCELREQDRPTTAVEAEIRKLRQQQRQAAAKPMLQAGERLDRGRYELLSKCGSGNYGVVWRAFDTQMRILVAIKAIHPQLMEDEAQVDRFKRGARKMAECNHAHIVRVRDGLRTEEGFWYYVMEHLSGRSLHERVLNKTLTTEQAMRVVLDIGEALAHAHGRGLVHRDVKPQNILLSSEGEGLLTDFDLVWALDTTGGTGTAALGTLVYAAPEALEGAEPRAAMDVHALAMTAVFVLHGSALPMAAMHTRQEFLGSLQCSVPMKKVLQRATQVNPAARYGSIEEFTRELAQAWKQSLVDQVDRAEPPKHTLLLPEEVLCFQRYAAAFTGRYGSWATVAAPGHPANRSEWAASLPLKRVYLSVEAKEGGPDLKFGWDCSMQHGESTPPFSPSELSDTPSHRVLMGYAGSGKTTYARRLALELLDRGAALPLFIEARALASFQRQSGLTGESLIVRFLEESLARLVSAQDAASILSFLRAEAAPVPILFIDAWEHLGDSADRIRNALYAFLNRFARVRLFITAQPCAQSLPTGKEYKLSRVSAITWGNAEDFARRVADAAAEAAPEIALCARYWAHILKEGPRQGTLDRLLIATPLFFVTALLSDPFRPFPTQRHHLYRSYLEILFDSAPPPIKRLTLAGFLSLLTRLALDILNTSVPAQPGTNLRLAQSPTPERLFHPLAEDDSEELFTWLRDSLGLLSHRSEGHYGLRSKALLDYLHALRIHEYEPTLDLKSVVHSFCSKAPDNYGSTALSLIVALCEPAQKTWFLGYMKRQITKAPRSAEEKQHMIRHFGDLLSQGHGEPDDIDLLVEAAWEERRVQRNWPLSCFWMISREESRRQELTERINAKVAAGEGLEWAEVHFIHELLCLPGKLARPHSGCIGRTLIDVLEDGIDGPGSVALGRTLSAGGLLWSGGDPRLLLFGLWPSLRRMVGQRAQLLACLGWLPADIQKHAPRLLLAPQWNRTRADLLRRANLKRMNGAEALSRDLERDALCGWLAFQSRMSIRELEGSERSYWNERILDNSWDRWPKHRYFGFQSAPIEKMIADSALQYGQYVLLAQHALSREAQLEAVIQNCHAQVGPRALLAYLPHGCQLLEIPEVRLLSRACQISLRPTQDRSDLDRVLRDCEGSVWRIWLDLARYIASDADPEALARLKSPLESYQDELSKDNVSQWAARFFLSGDVWFPGGETLTVDSLCTAAGQPSLPFLEELPAAFEDGPPY